MRVFGSDAIGDPSGVVILNPTGSYAPFSGDPGPFPGYEIPFGCGATFTFIKINDADQFRVLCLG